MTRGAACTAPPFLVPFLIIEEVFIFGLVNNLSPLACLLYKVIVLYRYRNFSVALANVLLYRLCKCAKHLVTIMQCITLIFATSPNANTLGNAFILSSRNYAGVRSPSAMLQLYSEWRIFRIHYFPSVTSIFNALTKRSATLRLFHCVTYQSSVNHQHAVSHALVGVSPYYLQI